MNKVTILGTGTSTGVPILGCKCRVCQSNDPRNKRLRTSALIETEEGKKILIDASPDLRTQLLRSNISNIDWAILTHDHADHTHGIDDLRPFTFERKDPLQIYADDHTAHALTQKFPYIFQRSSLFAERPVIGGGIPLLDLVIIKTGMQKIGDAQFDFSSLPHGYGNSLCFIHDKLGYIVDCRSISEDILKKFHDAKLELLIIDCLRFKPHETHLHFGLTLEYIKKISPSTAMLTHMGHELDYLDLIDRLRKKGVENVFPALDGQTFLYSSV